MKARLGLLAIVFLGAAFGGSIFYFAERPATSSPDAGGAKSALKERAATPPAMAVAVPGASAVAVTPGPISPSPAAPSAVGQNAPAARPPAVSPMVAVAAAPVPGTPFVVPSAVPNPGPVAPAGPAGRRFGPGGVPIAGPVAAAKVFDPRFVQPATKMEWPAALLPDRQSRGAPFAPCGAADAIWQRAGSDDQPERPR